MGLDNVRPRGVLVFNQYDQLIQAAVAGQGIAIGRERLIKQLLSEGRLQIVGNTRREMADRGNWLVLASPTPRPEVCRFVEWLRTEATESAP
jgi:DNA-binding transcriptional LysR family regulator